MTRWVTRRDMLRMSAAASLASLTGFGRQAFAAQSPLYWPGPTAWETREPAEVAMSAEGVADALAYAGAHNSTGVVVLRGGRIIADQYWHGCAHGVGPARACGCQSEAA